MAIITSLTIELYNNDNNIRYSKQHDNNKYNYNNNDNKQ